MAIFPFSVDSVRIGTANITASGGNIVLPAGTQVGNQPVATVVEVSTGGGPKITNLQITDNAWTVLDDTAVDTAGGYILITGTNFVSGALVYFNQTPATSVAFVGTTTLRVTVPALTAGTYIVYVINPDGGTAIRVPGLTASANPAWQTASALPEQYDGVAITLNLVATDATSYTVTSGSLPPGLSLNANTGVISGTVTGVAVDTVYTFTVRATDAQLQDSPRTFTITITVSDPYFKLTTLLLSGSAISANTVIRDSSTNNFNLTVFGDARASNFTPYGTGWSVYFDGTNDYLTSSSNADFNLGTTFSIEGWIYSLAATKQVIANLSGFVFIIESTGLLNFYNGSTLSGGSGSAVSRNTWVHVAFTRDASNVVRGFVNGVLTWAITVSTASSQTAVFIGSEGGTQSFVNGYLSNIRIVKGAIPSSYQTSSTTAGTTIFTPPTSNLTEISGTSLLICQSNRFVDNSTVPKPITPTNGPLAVAFNPFNITNTGTDGSMYFDGTGDYCTTSGNAAFALGTGDFCLETWIYPNSISTGTFDRIVATSDYNGAGFDWTLNTASSALYVAGTAYSISNLVVKSWNHLVYTRSGGVLRGFLNGNLAVYNASATGNVTSTGELRIGTGYSGTAYNGYISNLRIVKGSVPAAYQTSSTTINTTVFSPPTTLLTAVTGTSLLTLQYDQPHNNHTFLDSSSNQFLITRNGNATQGTFSPFSLGGWSYYFNGTASASQAILTPTNAQYAIGTGQFSIESWVYLQSKSTSSGNSIHTIISQGNNANNLMWALGIIDSTNYISWGLTGSGITLSAYPVTKNTWNHIVVTRNASNEERIFLNGTLINLRTNTTNYSNASSTQIQIGTSYDTNYPGVYGVSSYGNTFSGYISQLRLDIGGIPSAYQTSSTTVGQTVFTPPATLVIATPNTKLLIGQDNRFKDNSTINAVLTPNGNTSVQTFSPFAATAVYNPVAHGGSAYFDGSGDYLSFVNNNQINFGSSPFTIEVWFYSVSTNTRQDFITQWATNNKSSYLGIGITGVASRIQFAYSTTGGNELAVTDTTNFVPYQWYHVAACRTANTISLFVNGVRVATTTETGAIFNSTRTPITVGAYSGNSGEEGLQPLVGYLSGLRVIKGSSVYDATQTSITVPAVPVSSTSNTQLLLNFTDAAILDSTGRTAIETVADAKSSSVVTKFNGGSMYFDGTGDAINIRSSDLLTFGTGDWTVEFWVYHTSVSGQQTYLGDTGGATSGPYIYKDSSHKVGLYYSSQILTGTTTIAINTWYFIVLSRASGTVRLFTNGIQETSASDTTNLTVAIQWVGGDTFPSGYLSGYMNDIRVTKGYARYTANFTAPTAPVRLK
jgi:hypothetical protein